MSKLDDALKEVNQSYRNKLATKQEIKELMLDCYKEARRRYNNQDGLYKHNQTYFFEEVVKEL